MTRSAALRVLPATESLDLAAWDELGREIAAAEARGLTDGGGRGSTLGRLVVILRLHFRSWLEGEAVPSYGILQDWLAVLCRPLTPGFLAEREAAERWLTPEARRSMADEIHRAGNREVSFVLRRQPDGRFGEPRVLCRGNAGRTVLAFQELDVDELALHNHPAGDLAPSEVDLNNMSSRPTAIDTWPGYGIIDQAADRLYLVRDPQPVAAAGVRRSARPAASTSSRDERLL